MQHFKICTSFFVTALVIFTSPVVNARSDIRSEQVQFKQGTNSAVIKGRIRGYEVVDYILNAQAGQSMNVSMATDNGANYFNILEPGETEVAIFNGSTGDNQYEGVLKKSGNYTIRVYMMRSAARRNEVANYRLETIIAGRRNQPSTSGQPVNRSDTRFNATGNIPCAMAASQPTGSCPFGVTRQGNGSGSVTITKPDGRTRTIFFENGEATGYDMSQADRGRFSVKKRGDLSIIHIGRERYEIPDAVIFGG